MLQILIYQTTYYRTAEFLTKRAFVVTELLSLLPVGSLAQPRDLDFIINGHEFLSVLADPTGEVAE